MLGSSRVRGIEVKAAGVFPVGGTLAAGTSRFLTANAVRNDRFVFLGKFYFAGSLFGKFTGGDVQLHGTRALARI